MKRVLPPINNGPGSKGSLDRSDEMAEHKSSNSAESRSGEPSSYFRRAKVGRRPNSKSANGNPSSKNSIASGRERSLKAKLAYFTGNDGKATDLEAADSFSVQGIVEGSASMSGSNNDWERLLNMRHVDNDTLSILKSATAFRHGNDTSQGRVSQRQVILRYIPMFMRWDAQSTRIREFHSEMRLISRLRVRTENMQLI